MSLLEYCENYLEEEPRDLNLYEACMCYIRNIETKKQRKLLKQHFKI